MHFRFKDIILQHNPEVCTKARRKTPPSWVCWGHTAPGQHVHSAQTPEEKNFLN